jgi:hypothetical protein
VEIVVEKKTPHEAKKDVGNSGFSAALFVASM